MNAPDTSMLPETQGARLESPTETLYSEINNAYRHFNRTLFQSKLPECLITLRRKKGHLAMVSMDRFVQAVNGLVFTHEISVNPAYFAAAKPKDFLSNLVHEMCRIQVNMKATADVRGAQGYHCKEWGQAMETIGLVPSHNGKPGGKKYGYKMSHYVQEDGPFDRSATVLLEKGWALTWIDRMAEFLDEDDDDEEALEDEETQTPPPPEASTSGAADQPSEDDDKAQDEIPNPSAPTPSPDATPSAGVAAPKPVRTAAAKTTRTHKALRAHLNQSVVAALISPKPSSSGNRTKYSCPKCTAAVWGKSGLNLVCGTCQKPMPVDLDTRKGDE
ncbi:MAG: hypothetical protein BGP25_15815 [Lysobacterales bacterium 63-13]|nr:MAG: hypothetical protein BGP25_15815 [Xanthomonadales bacterium 63-13]